MSAIAELVTLLLSTGIPPESISSAVDLAQRHAVETSEFHRNSTGIPPETTADKRKAWDRERKRKIAETKKGGSLLLTSFSEEILKEEETSKKEESKKERAREAELLDESFGLFWGRWPNKVGKPVALKALRSALKRACHAEIMAGVENYIRDKPPDRPWLNPATFLNQNRWEDQPATVSISKSLTEFQRKQAETNDVRSQLRSMANGGRSGGQATRLLSIDNGERSEDVRSGPSSNLFALPRTLGSGGS